MRRSRSAPEAGLRRCYCWVRTMESGYVPDTSADEPLRLRWLVPIRGIFQSVYERWADPWLDAPMPPLSLETAVTWRLANEGDREAMNAWFSFYNEYFSPDDANTYSSSETLLEGEDTLTRLEAAGRTTAGDVALAFVLAASLHTQSHLRVRWLRFERREERLLPHSGGPPVEFSVLPGWDLAQGLRLEERDRIVRSYAHVRRAFPSESDHSFRRALGAYRVAMTSRFLDATAILLCASLEALAADDEASVVSRRLIPRFLSVTEAAQAEDVLKRLYLLRHWFAHSILIPLMREKETRLTTLRDGAALVKEILASALADDSFFDVSARGVREARAYLDS
jgi:hypothetical protein